MQNKSNKNDTSKNRPETSAVHPLITRLHSGETSVGVVGLGYVGLPLTVAFAEKYPVIGFDINKKRVKELNAHIDVTDSVSALDLKACKAQFSSDPKCLAKCSVIIVAVPTPVTSQQQPDFTPLIKASETIANVLQKGSYICFESTVYPGATEEWCVSTLEKVSGLKCGKDFKVGYSPERINPGDRIHTFKTIVKITSGQDEESAEAFAQLYESVLEKGVHRASSIKVAEAAKVFENAQRDVNIATVNELSFICHKLGIDTHDVLAACKTKWNFLDFKPGLVGGHCIGVDPYYLIAKSQEMSTDPIMTRSARITNEKVAEFVAGEILRAAIQQKMISGEITINILGFTYKEDTPDIRNTQMARLAKELASSGCIVNIADPMADSDEVKHEYGVKLTPFRDLPTAALTVLAVPHRTYMSMSLEDWNHLCAEPRLIFDLRAVLDRTKFREAGFKIWRL